MADIAAINQPSPADVRAVLTTARTDTQIQAIIDDATLIVAECVAALDEERQAAIIKYVVADMIAGAIDAAGAGTLQSKSLGDASEAYATSSGQGEIGQTAYWRQAVALDPNGCIARLGRRRAFFEKV